MKYDVITDLSNHIPHKIRDHSINQGKLREMTKLSNDFEEFIKELIKDIKFIPNHREILKEKNEWKLSAKTKNANDDILCMDETHIVLSNKNKQIYIKSDFKDINAYLLIYIAEGCYIEEIKYNHEGKAQITKEYYDREALEFLESMYKLSENIDIRENLSQLIKEKSKELYILPDEEETKEIDNIGYSELATYLNNSYQNEEEYMQNFFKKEKQRTRTK